MAPRSIHIHKYCLVRFVVVAVVVMMATAAAAAAFHFLGRFGFLLHAAAATAAVRMVVAVIVAFVALTFAGQFFDEVQHDFKFSAGCSGGLCRHTPIT